LSSYHADEAKERDRHPVTYGDLRTLKEEEQARNPHHANGKREGCSNQVKLIDAEIKYQICSPAHFPLASTRYARMRGFSFMLTV